MFEVGGAIWLLGSVTVRGEGQVRFCCVDRGHGFEAIELPPAIGLGAWALSSTDIWFCGYGGSVAHFDGTTWSKHVWPKFYFDFQTVYATSGSNVWLKTAQKLAHFDGKEFRLETAPELLEDTWSVVWGVEDDVYVLLNRPGESGFAKRDRDETWTKTMLGFGGATLIGGAKNDLWIMSSSEGGWHFDGASWTRHATAKGRFWSLHARNGDALIAGDDGALGRWDGAKWSVSSFTSDRLTSVCRYRDGRIVAGGSQLYRERAPSHSPK